MTDNCSTDVCQMENSGVCPQHNVEVERRENLEKLASQIPGLVVATKTLLTTSSLILIMIAGSFAYTKIVKDDLITSVFKIYDSYESIDDKFDILKTDFERHKGEFVQKYSDLDGRITRIEK